MGSSNKVLMAGVYMSGCPDDVDMVGFSVDGPDSEDGLGPARMLALGLLLETSEKEAVELIHEAARIHKQSLSDA